MNTYQQILIMFDNFEIIFIGALFPPGTAVPEGRRFAVSRKPYRLAWTKNHKFEVGGSLNMEWIYES